MTQLRDSRGRFTAKGSARGGSGISVTFDYSEVLAWATDLQAMSTTWFPAAIMAAVTEAALFFEREAKMEAPHDTGRLRASIGHGPEGVWDQKFHKGKGYWIDVGTNVEYAPYMEFGFTMGTGHVAFIKKAGGFRYVHPFSFTGFHYMAKAAARTEPLLTAALARHIDAALAKGGWA